MMVARHIRSDTWPDIVAQHADQIPFLWQARTAAMRSWNATHDTLIHLDQRLIGSLDGLRLAGASADTAIDELWSSGWPGERFGRMILALERHDHTLIDELATTASSAIHERATVSAFGFVDAAIRTVAVQRLAASASTDARRMAARVCAIEPQQTGMIVQALLQDDEPSVAAAAWRATLSLDTLDARWQNLRAPADHDVAAQRLRALWMHTRDDACLVALMERTASDPAWRWRLSDCVRLASRDRGLRWMQQALAIEAHVELGLCLAAACGTAEAIEALTVRLPSLNADQALTAITSLALILGSARLFTVLIAAETADRATDGVSGIQTDPELPEALAAWWAATRADVPPDTRLLNGSIVDEQAISHSISSGVQPIRRAASVEQRAEQAQKQRAPTRLAAPNR
jgi:hypothetical protein